MDDVGTGALQDRGERPGSGRLAPEAKENITPATRAERNGVGGYACIIAGAELLAG